MNLMQLPDEQKNQDIEVADDSFLLITFPLLGSDYLIGDSIICLQAVGTRNKNNKLTTSGLSVAGLIINKQTKDYKPNKRNK